MSNIYMYPKEDYDTLESPNPYVPNTEKSLSENHVIVNKRPSSLGVINMFLYLLKTDIYFFNWIENLSKKRFGKIQTLLFFPFILLSKLMGKKIIWVLHNIYSHEKEHYKWTKLVFNFLIKKSDLILTHSSGGVDFVQEHFPKYVKKVKYLVHPVESVLNTEKTVEKKNSFLIWGTIHPYKGVIEFLENVKNSNDLDEIKIVISGICPDKELKNKLESHLNKNIIHIDEFQTMEDISQLASESEFVLFTYNSPSILSSGSLMDSIRMGASIIGPNKGAFKDLSGFGFINTYNNYEDINQIYKEYKASKNKSDASEITAFCQENSWDKYSVKLNNIGEGIL